MSQESNVTTGSTKTKDGCSIYYRLYSKSGRPKLVLIHSLALDGSIWDGVVAELQNDFELLVYDCRGHGKSERRPGKYSVQLFAEDLAALMDHCGWQEAYIAGCSMGGGAAQAFALAYPARTLGVGLIDTTAWYGANAPQEWRDRAAKASKEGFGSLLSFQFSRWFSPQYLEEHKSNLVALENVFLANEATCYESSCVMLGDCDLRNEIRQLKVPVAVIVGEEDFATPVAMSQELHQSIPGSTLTIIPAGRHLTPIQCPKEVAATLKELASRH